MKRLLVFALAVGMVAGLTAPVFATGVTCTSQGCQVTITYTPQSGPNAGLPQTVPVPVTIQENGTGVVRSFSTQFTDGASASITNLVLNPDPGIIFAFGAITGAFPAVFSYGISTPVAIGGAGKVIDATSSIGYTLTDGSQVGLGGAPGVTIAPFTPPHILVANDFTAGLAATNKGVDVGPAATWTGPPATGVSGPFSAANTFAGGPFVLMGATISFVLTAEDSAGLSGSVGETQRDVPVPEPATLLLVGCGLLGLIGFRKNFRD